MTHIIRGHGGSYRVGEDGELTQTEAPTQDHPEGNRPRDAEGKALDASTSPPTLPPAGGGGDPPPAPGPRRVRSVPAIAAASGD